ncbi:ABC transporter ATP-binding protein [Cyanobacterium stanieri LEGE 03274]|uniref:ABC transporter ATP-binding protein n=1 Tax=Cyanobacterium stanieri LEGE 03274 TaxID=1828756 RepID=A0ABR9V0N9_9CHRO|nr:ABC transporter ATP-binding protein [Cyanobacterium stanieri]MBE9221442.1 ABC transporter ATP-binding protein [Cyanobacterium stanieri LEGE 03274]
MSENKTKTLETSLPILKELLDNFAPYLKQEKILLFIAIVSIIADVCLRIIEPLPLKFVLDYVLQNKSINILYVGEISPITLLTICAVAVFAISAFRALAGYGSAVSLAMVGSRVMTKVRNRLYAHLQALSLDYHTTTRSGDLIIRISSDTSRLQEILITATLPLVVSILTLVGTVGIMFWINARLTAVALISLPFFSLAVNRLSQRIQTSSLQQRKREGLLAATSAESMTSIKLIQALCLENAFFEVFAHENEQSLRKAIETQRLSASLERIVDVIIALALAVVLWYGSWLVLQNALSVGDVIVFLTYLKNTFKPIQNFAKYTGRLAKSAASAQRVLNIFQEIPTIQDLPDAQPAPMFRGDVEFRDVSFTYGEGHCLLRGVNFRVKQGQLVAIVGVSGCGKSTMMNLLLRLYEPTQGQVLIDGHDIRDYTISSVRSQLSVVLQETILFAGTIRDNIAYGMTDVKDEEIIKASCLANAHDFISNLPQGYNTFMGERGATLSGGQRQRIAIARTAMNNTPILILDEPTTGLDSQNEQEVIQSLLNLAKGKTTFLITHDLNLAQKADLIINLEKGKVSQIINNELSDKVR